MVIYPGFVRFTERFVCSCWPHLLTIVYSRLYVESLGNLALAVDFKVSRFILCPCVAKILLKHGTEILSCNVKSVGTA